jgi:hypothetical protein
VGCLNCVVETGQAGGTMADMEESCAVGPKPTGAEPLLFDCSYDTGLLTSLAVLVEQARPLDSTLVAASAQYARVSTGSAELDVFCTHYARDRKRRRRIELLRPLRARAHPRRLVRAVATEGSG